MKPTWILWTMKKNARSYRILNECTNVAIIRTFSKSFGLAGLRIGYGVLPFTLADYMRRVRLPFP